jgi:S-DNA-T family DNA segregation ATPase FtsK/SpoIIIE
MEVIRQTNRASVSVLQRRLRIGYTRAARIMDLLEERGVVGPNRGAEPREILMDLDSNVPAGQ